MKYITITYSPYLQAITAEFETSDYIDPHEEKLEYYSIKIRLDGSDKYPFSVVYGI